MTRDNIREFCERLEENKRRASGSPRTYTCPICDCVSWKREDGRWLCGRGHRLKVEEGELRFQNKPAPIKKKEK